MDFNVSFDIKVSLKEKIEDEEIKGIAREAFKNNIKVLTDEDKEKIKESIRDIVGTNKLIITIENIEKSLEE